MLASAEQHGRVRLAYAGNNDAATLRPFCDGHVAQDAHVGSDGHAGYNAASLGTREHESKVQAKAERREDDAVQACHWVDSLLKRSLLGTHAGAVRDKHLEANLAEFAFRVPLR